MANVKLTNKQKIAFRNMNKIWFKTSFQTAKFEDVHRYASKLILDLIGMSFEERLYELYIVLSLKKCKVKGDVGNFK